MLSSLDWATVVALCGALIPILLFSFRLRKENKLHSLSVYQSLEVASNDIFKFEATNYANIGPYLLRNRPKNISLEDSAYINSLIFQTLNLFELAVSYRNSKIIDKTVYGSWVIWYYEIYCSWFFRETWDELRFNYTKELRDIFDAPIQHYNSEMIDEDMRAAFFSHVGEILNCPKITNWLNDNEITNTSAYKP